jgi:pimeloyl-ACP methyl ester carboxylesterase
MRRQTLAKGFALLCLGLGSAGFAAAESGVDRLVQLSDGRRIHLACFGAGAPTVILESGLGLPMAAWDKVKSRLAADVRVCTYERAGYGTSDPGPMPRDAKHVASDLAALIKAAQLPPPFVLVGHSLGADFVRLFAAEHHAEVSGVVLIEPAFKDIDRKLALASPETGVAIAKGNQIIEMCVGAVALGRTWTAADAEHAVCGPPPAPTSPLASPKTAQATISEFRNRALSGAEVAAAIRRPLRIPLIVLTAKRRLPPSAAAQELITREHLAIARTSLRGQQRIVEGSGHVIQYDQPDAVVQAVDEVIAMTPPEG